MTLFFFLLFLKVLTQIIITSFTLSLNCFDQLKCIQVLQNQIPYTSRTIPKKWMEYNYIPLLDFYFYYTSPFLPHHCVSKSLSLLSVSPSVSSADSLLLNVDTLLIQTIKKPTSQKSYFYDCLFERGQLKSLELSLNFSSDTLEYPMPYNTRSSPTIQPF